jgi:hypothetical protein
MNNDLRIGDIRQPVKAPNLVNARAFVDLAQSVAQAARDCGAVVPGFQTLPRLATNSRVLRRSTRGAIVCIRTAGKSSDDVENDMIEGVVRVQEGLTEPQLCDLRGEVRRVLASQSTRLIAA